MKKLNVLFTVMLCSIFSMAFTSCSDDDDENFSMSNQDFVTRASSSNMLEIAAGGLAVNQGSNANVKAYGQHMVADHSKAATEMQAVIKNKDLTMPSSMLEEHQQMLNSLKDLTGEAFDKRFAAMMVTSHQQTINLFEQAADDEGVPDNDLRSFASGKLPTLKAHLEEAEDLQAEVND